MRRTEEEEEEEEEGRPRDSKEFDLINRSSGGVGEGNVSL